MSAISSAVHLFLGIFGIALLFLFSRFPGGNQVVVFALGIVPDFEDHGTQPATAPSDGTELFLTSKITEHSRPRHHPMARNCCGSSLFWSTMYTWSNISCASFRLTPCLRLTSRLFWRSKSRRISGIYNSYTIGHLARYSHATSLRSAPGSAGAPSPPWRCRVRSPGWCRLRQACRLPQANPRHREPRPRSWHVPARS